MAGRAVAVAGGLSVVAAGLLGVAGCATRSPSTSAATTATVAATPPVTRISSAPLAATTTTAAPTNPSTSTSSTPSTSSTSTTVVPIVSYSADIGILAPVAVVAPVWVSIPALGVEGPVLPVGVDGLGQMDVPPDARTLAWYRFGPKPGDPGSAVIAGHLNWKGVEGIFSNLAAIPPGERLTVAYDDGTQQAFVVTAVELVDKPAVAVNGTFARDGERLLRLVTCGGEFDRSTRHYRSNVIVTAVPA